MTPIYKGYISDINDEIKVIRNLKNIDVIEGAVKNIIKLFFDGYVNDRNDDTEYIKSIKTTIEGTETFVKSNPEITQTPETLVKVLYSYSKELWLEHIRQGQEKEDLAPENQFSQDSYEYYEYYFDYIYTNGCYPP